MSLQPTAEREQLAMKIMASISKIDPSLINSNTSFFDIGGDSISAIVMADEFRRHGLHITTQQIFRAAIPARLAEVAQEAWKEPSAIAAGAVGDTPLTPLQERLIQALHLHPCRYDRDRFFIPRKRIDYMDFHEAVRKIVSHHDMLRARFYLDEDDCWTCNVLEPDACEVNVSHILCESEEEVWEQAKRLSSRECAGEHVYCAALFEIGSKQRMYFATSSLVADLASWRILLEDLDRLLCGGELGEKTTSFREWSQWMEQQASNGGNGEKQRFIQLLNWDAPSTYQFARTDSDSISGICKIVNEINASALELANEAYKTDNHHLILAALLISLQETTGEGFLPIVFEDLSRRHAGEYLDLSRTVGQFGTHHLTSLSMTNGDELSTIVKGIKAALYTTPAGDLTSAMNEALTLPIRQGGPNQGERNMTIYFRCSEFYCDGNRELSLFTTEEQCGVYGGGESQIYNAISVEYVLNTSKSLQMIMSFNPLLFQTDLLASWGKEWVASMQRIITHCCSPDTAGASSIFDFTLLKDPTLLEEIEAEFLPSLGLKPREVEDIYPATPLQTSFVSRLLQDSGSYLMQSVYEVERDFDIDRLLVAWTKIASANTILRTMFITTREGVLQVVLKRPQQAFVQMVEWSQSEVDEQQEVLLAAERQRGFSLECMTFVRFSVAHIKGTSRHRLLWTMHHSIMDGWSMPLFFEDLHRAYLGGAVEARPPFRAHIESLLSGNSTEATEFWRSVFDGATVPGQLEIVDMPRKSEEKGFRDLSFDLGVTSEEIQSYCQKLGVTTSNFLRAMWAVVLYHYTRCGDVIFGCVVLGRESGVRDVTKYDISIEVTFKLGWLISTNCNRIFGPLINTIPLRAVLDTAMTVERLLLAIQEFHINSLPYSQTSLSDIKQWTDLPWTRAMFPTLFNYISLDIFSPSVRAGSQIFKSCDIIQPGNTEYSLVVVLHPNNGTIFSNVNYDASAFDGQAITRMMSKYRMIVHEVLRSNSADRLTVGDLNQLSEQEVTFVENFSRGISKKIPFECLHNGFEEMAGQFPLNIAVEEGDRSVTYKELDVQANAFAHFLSHQGVGPGIFVGLVVTRSIEMIVGILAVLKAGGAYVPIDAGYPCQRIASILDDIPDPILLSTVRDVGSVPELYSQKVILVDGCGWSCDEVSKPAEVATGEDLAYIIFTSGTTGKPKGVMVQHKGAINNVLEHPTASHLKPGIRAGGFMSVSFDACVADIFMTLSKGATLILPEDNIASTLSRVDFVRLTPTGLLKFDPKSYKNIKVINTVGEVCPPSLVDRWGAQADFYNDYGATECSIFCTCTQPLKPGMSPTMGRVFPNMRAYVLDNELRPVPIGVKGQMYIGGVGVAMGYLNLPELTAKKFVEDPFAGPGSRMYASGDVVRWLSSGELEFCGRVDDQVKLKGYRVELEEVAIAMRRYEGVKSAVAVVHDNTLYGFVTPAEVDDEAVRDSLFDFLPDYMVPAAIFSLEDFPMTTNGKVDKSKLMNISQHQRKPQYGAISDNQRRVIESMALVLNLDASCINLHSSFFTLGGDSISAIALVSALRKKNLHASVQQIFRSPTPARLSEVVKSHLARKSMLAAVGDTPLTPIQNHFLTGKTLRLNHYNQGWVLIPRERIGFNLFKQAISRIVAHHDTLRARYYRDNTERWNQVIMKAEACPANVVHILCETNEELQAHIKHIASSFDIERGNVHKAALFEIKGEQRIGFFIHHLVVDLVSWRILLDDLETLLRGFQLEEKTLSYREWAFLQVQQADKFSAEKWIPHLSTTNMDLIRCVNKSRVSSDNNRILYYRISNESTKLLDMANSAYRTNTQDLILTALLLSFRKNNRLTLLSLNLEGHGREPWDNQLDMTKTVGWFTTIYPVTLSSEVSDTISEAVKKVKSTLQSIPDKGLSYGIIKYLNSTSTGGAELVKQHELSPIYFNYFGHFYNFEQPSSLFVPDAQFDSCDISENEILHDVLLNCYYDENGSLELSFSFNSSLFYEDILASWGRTWVEEMHWLIKHCCDTNTPGGFTSTDFTLATNPELILEIENIHLPALKLLPRDVEDIYPATPLQSSFISALESDRQSYILQWVYEIEGEFDEGRMRSAWYRVAAANSILRTSFISTQVGVYQVVLKTPPDVFEDTSEWELDGAELAQEGFLLFDRCRGFNIHNVAFTRIKVVHIKNTNRHRLFLTMHHNITDAWSSTMLFADLLKAYSGGIIETRPPFKAHIEAIMATNIEDTRQYWQTLFNSADVHKNFRILNSQMAENETYPITRTYNLDIPFDRILRHCREYGVTISNFLRAIWAISLRHYTHCDDIIFGCVLLGRDNSIFNATRVILKNSTSLSEALQAIQAQHVSSLSHSNVSLGDIVRWTGIQWPQCSVPTVLSFQDSNFRNHTIDYKPDCFDLSEIDSFENTGYPLYLTLYSSGDTLRATALTNQSMIKPSTVDGLITTFEEILQKLAQHKCDPFNLTLFHLEKMLN
ncbi:uncharacterized protein VTP21DRAFT_9642 [Calcarisporiella thermophila]|uniref:uncharacterized protein n=1 Tax=Calcarisporiella thermophila TaxID=911321 RepID=UPI003743C7B6